MKRYESDDSVGDDAATRPLSNYKNLTTPVRRVRRTITSTSDRSQRHVFTDPDSATNGGHSIGSATGTTQARSPTCCSIASRKIVSGATTATSPSTSQSKSPGKSTILLRKRATLGRALPRTWRTSSMTCAGASSESSEVVAD